MKTFLALCLFLLFTLSVQSQSLKSNLIKTVAAINSILHENKMVRFTNQHNDTFYPTKINANLQGDVFCINSSTRFGENRNGIILNLLKIKSFVIKEDEIVALGQAHESIGVIALDSEQKRKAITKELDALL